MSEAIFGHVATLLDGANLALTGVTDMVVAQTAQGPVLYTISRMDGGWITAYRVATDGALTQIDVQAMPGTGAAGGIYELALHDGLEGPQLLVTGINSTGFYTVDIEANGRISSPEAVGGDDVPAHILDTEVIELRGDTYIFTAFRGADGVSVFQVDEDGDVALAHGDGVSIPHMVGITAIGSVEVNGQTYLLAASGSENAMISYRFSSTGRPQEVDRVSALDDGLGIATPSALEVVTVAGNSFVVMASSGSSTLSVFEVGAGGALEIADHVLDSLNTRFAGVSVMDSITHNDRGFVVVAGSDDGVTLFEVMPDGRLEQLGTLADATNTTLDGVSALSLGVVGDVLHLAVTSGSEAGLTSFTVDVGGFDAAIMGTEGDDTLTGTGGDDQLIGGAGDDELSGGAGDDLLMDGAGSDVLRGGAGADHFLLAGDNASDVIRDFNITEDTIDLSGWALLRSPNQLEFAQIAGGIVISFGEEVLTVFTSNGANLSPAQILALDLIGQARFLPSWFEGLQSADPDPQPDPDPVPDPLPDPDPEPQPEPDPEPEPDPVPPPPTVPVVVNLRLTGTAGRDELSGDLGNDTILGMEGDDVLVGFGGSDFIQGYDGNDYINGNADTDVLQGGGGNDRMYGGQGFDTMFGDDGNDILIGGDGFDFIVGGEGDDSLTGNNGADALFGDGGNDTLWGGLNIDSMYGGSGDDLLNGQSGGDVLEGGDGDDTLNGNAGADVLDGGNGDDNLSGGINHDTLTGGRGDDTLFGGNGSDFLMGERGSDSLVGNAGNDTLDGGSGNDYLFGGVGADTFVFSQGNDRVADFGLVDTLMLDSDLWGGGTMTINQLERYVTVTEDGDLFFNFSSGNSLLLNNISNLSTIFNDIEFI